MGRGSGPAGDDEPATGGSDGRVAQSDGQMGDDPRTAVGAVRDDRVEPARAGVSTDDVRGATDGCGERIGGPRRK